MKFRAASLAIMMLAITVLAHVSANAQSSLPGSNSGAPDLRRSGFDAMGKAVQAMQLDTAQNPGMLWVAQGETLWRQAETTATAAAQPSCQSCHSNPKENMKGVAARYPAFDTKRQTAITLKQRINACRTDQQRLTAFAFESQALLSLEAFVAHQSKGLPIAPASDLRLASALERGKALYNQPMGQLNMSCMQCHDQQAGKRLGSAPIPQAHPTGYPIYRLEWQGLGSLARRLRNCLSGVRAEPYAHGAIELTEIELYLANRAQGMLIETPAVRP
jgi:L-cysteine S-thiosulfotransferase